MSSIRKQINNAAEAFFQSALKGNRFANLVVKVVRYLSPGAYGVWLFRKGDVSESYRFLKEKTGIGLYKRCAERSKFILSELEHALPEHTLHEVRQFNGNVLFAVHSNGCHYPNGYAHRTALISEGLIKNGFKIFGITRPGYPWDLNKTADLPRITSSTFGGVQYKHFYDEHEHIFEPEGTYIDLYAAQLHEHAQLNNCTVIHAHSSYINGLAAAKASRELDILSVYEMRGLWHLSRAVKEPLFNKTEHFQYLEKMELKAAYLCDKVVTLNHSLKQWLIFNGVSADKISVIPNGVSKVPEVLKSPNASFTLGFVGSITEYEGLEDVIKAFTMLNNCHSEIRFQIYGDGAFRTRIEKLVNRLGLTDKISFKGHVQKEEIASVYSKMDAIVVARKDLDVTRLVTPLKLVEAMMFGKPCIVSDLPALREVVEPDISALVVKPNSPSEIARAVESLVNNPTLCTALADNAKQAVQTHFNWEDSVSTYSSVYGA